MKYRKKVGGNYFTVGLDMQCRKVAHKVMFHSYEPVGIARLSYDGKWMQQDCVVLSNGVKVLSDSSKLFHTADELNLS